MFKRIWADPVWSKVISAGIIGGLALLGTYLLNLWPNIWPPVFAFLGSKLPVWHWLLIVWGLPCVGSPYHTLID